MLRRIGPYFENPTRCQLQGGSYMKKTLLALVHGMSIIALLITPAHLPSRHHPAETDRGGA
jgi:hypothetical protein